MKQLQYQYKIHTSIFECRSSMLQYILPGRYFTSPNDDKQKTMTAAVYKTHGASNTIHIEASHYPIPASDQALVKIYSTCVNPIDVKLRKHPISNAVRPTPKIPGTDIAGIVISAPANSEFTVGQEVFAMMPLLFWKYGASAEYAAIPTSLLSPIPNGLSMNEAASLPLVSLTVMQGFDSVIAAKGGNINALVGSKILVTAGSGGVGSIAVQYAKHVLGASIVASTCRGTKGDFVKSLGADLIIDYTQDQLGDLIKDYDVVFDTLAYEYMNVILSSESTILRRDAVGGHYIHVGGSSPSLSPGDPGTDMLGLSVPEARIDRLLGHYMRQGASSLSIWSHKPQYHVVFVRPDGNKLRRMKGYVEDGKVHAVVHKTFSLNDISLAHDEVESGHCRGKVVVTVCDSATAAATATAAALVTDG